MEDNKQQPTLLDNWIGWLQARIPALKESHNVYWLKQAMGGYKSENEQYFPKDSVPTPEAPSTESVPSADIESLYIKVYGHSKYAENTKTFNGGEVKSFANLCVEQREKEWEKEKAELYKMIKSDSVYALLRYGVKSPSSSGVDDCEDDEYYNLYQLCVSLNKSK